MKLIHITSSSHSYCFLFTFLFDVRWWRQMMRILYYFLFTFPLLPLHIQWLFWMSSVHICACRSILYRHSGPRLHRIMDLMAVFLRLSGLLLWSWSLVGSLLSLRTWVGAVFRCWFCGGSLFRHICQGWAGVGLSGLVCSDIRRKVEFFVESVGF